MSRRARIEDVIAYPHLNWNWISLTVYSDISVNEMILHPEFPWACDQLMFTSIGREEILYLRAFLSRIPVDVWNDVSSHVTWSVVKKNLDLPWVLDRIQYDEPLTKDDFNIIKMYPRSWNWTRLSEHMDVQVILDNPEYPWDQSALTKNESLLYDQCVHFPDTPKPCEDRAHVVKVWHAANVIKRAWRRCSINPEYKVCQKLVALDFFSTMNHVQNSCYSGRNDSVQGCEI